MPTIFSVGPGGAAGEAAAGATAAAPGGVAGAGVGEMGGVWAAATAAPRSAAVPQTRARVVNAIDTWNCSSNEGGAYLLPSIQETPRAGRGVGPWYLVLADGLGLARDDRKA